MTTSAKWRTLGLLSLAELLAMSLWFSATAVTPALIARWQLDAGAAAWLTMAVQIGFVAGALLVALFNAADLWPPRRVVAGGACLGAAANAVIPLVDIGFMTAVGLRVLTGMSLAAVYPVGMKIMATWTKEDRGLGLGLLVGALSVGSASPHLVRGMGGVSDWRSVMLAASVAAVIGAVIVLRYGTLGPYRAPSPRFRWSYMGRALTDRGLRLANLGYLGHMWELYAMWTWIALFLSTVYAGAGAGAASSWFGELGAERSAALVTFAVIGVGGLGSLLAGHLADRWGRSRTTIVSMVMSGACAASIGWFSEGHPYIITMIAIVWGFAIVADSAQFSSAVSELAEQEYMGTLLTAQTMMGFLLTMVSIRLVPPLVETVGWRWAFATLAVGPAIGSWAMWQLGRSPYARQLAGGRG